MQRLLLVHGAVTDHRVWSRTTPYLAAALPGWDVVAPDRPRTGSLDLELDWLASLVTPSTWVVGLSGGATLGLALAASGVAMAGAVLHEPAVGSLLPGLLAPVGAAFAASGAVGLGRTLYGASWTPSMTSPDGLAAAGAELAMFRSFEPAPVSPSAGRIVVTVGGHSPPARHEAAAVLVPLGCAVDVVAGVGHFGVHDHPQLFAAAVVAAVSG